MPHLKTVLCLSFLVLSACASSPTTEIQSPPGDTNTNPSVPSVPQNTPVSQAPIPNPIFEPILPKIKQETQIPILLPDYIFGSDGATQVYATVETVTPSQYQIILGLTPDCNGGTACRVGTVSGEELSPSSADLEGKAVPLDEGITGYFVDAVCGANCSDSTMTWDQNGIRYQMGIKAGKPEDLVKMANSAIASGTY
ncbi:hypothetical protein [Laspinema olomoucense]|uniref:Lipoprotein n=1 Tax=Laspinema olomoucense D3b TaxID=2953688 RepID=A0ABT2N594_9CYAN|nr:MULTISPECIES: hypothetical protein [unclassified Laspinema]MCT7977863.1 hypothetical protein [Laspinema sp. D3b]MCT7990549.1 hypothetical protein [Laspinema sp. D3a]MCT7994123.1 hypothetical protein [Laspinema sp. D3c]